MAEEHSPEPVGRVVRTSSTSMSRLDSQRRELPSNTGCHIGVVRPMPSSKDYFRVPIAEQSKRPVAWLGPRKEYGNPSKESSYPHNNRIENRLEGIEQLLRRAFDEQPITRSVARPPESLPTDSFNVSRDFGDSSRNGPSYADSEMALEGSSSMKAATVNETGHTDHSNLETAMNKFNVLAPPSLENAEAFLLGAIYAIEVSQPMLAWQLVSGAGGICQTLGWHQLDSPYASVDRLLYTMRRLRYRNGLTKQMYQVAGGTYLRNGSAIHDLLAGPIKIYTVRRRLENQYKSVASAQGT
uniref:Uncharacterized protein n=1 Tax=Fusarium oxysporum (strain Fo5176) TaxID=660025 RepID=A0A0C4DIA1_FUSOF